MTAMNMLGVALVTVIVAKLYIDFMEWLTRPIDISESRINHLKLAIIWVIVSIAYWWGACQLYIFLSKWIIK